MKRSSIFLLALLITSPAFAGGIVDKTSFFSKSLNETRQVNVYLPEGYDPGGAISYPVIYYLHGAGGNQQSPFNYPINLDDSLDTLIANKAIQPLIAVAADGSNAPAIGCWYTNSIHPDFGNFEDYIVYDLVEFVEANYKVIPSREKRGIQGISMGGFGCMKIGLRHPDIYKGVASNAGAFEFWTFIDPYWIDAILQENSGPPYHFDPSAGDATKGLFDMCGAFSPNLNNPPYFVNFLLDQNGNIEPTAKAQWELQNPAYLATLLPPDANLSIYFDCGKSDEFMFHPANVKFTEILDQLNIPYEFESYDGTHTSKAGPRARIGVKKLDAAMAATWLVSDGQTVSSSLGGMVNFYLTADWGNANRQYIMLGSISGTAPGTKLPGGTVTLPLNWDLFTNMVITYGNTVLFQDFLGTLGDAGFGAAQLNLAPIPGAAGLTMHFAYALNNPWDFVSNPVGIEIVP